MKFNYEFLDEHHSRTKYVIYLITNTISQKYYIGQTRRELKERWKDYKNDLLKPIQIKKKQGCNIRLKRSVQKCYKKFNHTDFLEFSVLEVIDVSNLNTEEEKQELLNLREIELIKEYRKIYGKTNVFNVTDGGYRGPFTEKEKLEQSQRLMNYYQTEEGIKRKEEQSKEKTLFYQTEKGKKIAKQISEKQKGKHSSPETEFKSEDVMGEKNPFYGKTHTEETKQKLREIQLGKTLEERLGIEKAALVKENSSKAQKAQYETEEGLERRQKMSKRMSGKNNPYAKIYDLSLAPLVSPEGIKYIEIVCLSDFAREHNLPMKELNKLIHNKRKTPLNGWKIINETNEK